MEAKIPQAPGLLANERDIEAATQAVRVASDKTGMTYLYDASFGPAAIIVPRSYDQHVLRFEQSIGVGLPLLGRRTAQILSVVDTQEKVALARIAFEEARRQRLAALRDAYVQYWENANEAAVAQDFVQASQAELSRARTLRQTGFYTYSDLLDFLDSVDKVKSEESGFQSLERGQLALVQSAVGIEVAPFRPTQPEFFDCTAQRTISLNSAYSADATLARLDAAVVQTKIELARVKGSSVDAGVEATAGSVTDINVQTSGYDLRAALDLSLPTHGRDEERALRDQYAAELTSLSLQQEQRRVDIASAVDSLLADVESSQAALAQALKDEAARKEDLRKSIVQYNTIRQAGSAAFDDVNQKRIELYAASRAVSAARADVLLKANQLLLVAPGTCSKQYQPMPTFTIPPGAMPRTKGTAAPKPAPAPTPRRTPAPVTAPTPTAPPKAKPQANQWYGAGYKGGTPSPSPSASPAPAPAPSATPRAKPRAKAGALRWFGAGYKGNIGSRSQYPIWSGWLGAGYKVGIADM